MNRIIKLNSYRKNILLSGQSLFEVIVALALVTLIITAVVTLATSSIRNADFSRDNALATKYAQEAVEWMRQERDVSWSTFRTATLSKTQLGTLSWSAGTDVIPGTKFKRTMKFDHDGDDSVTADVIVKWEDGNGVHEVKSRTILTNWQEL